MFVLKVTRQYLIFLAAVYFVHCEQTLLRRVRRGWLNGGLRKPPGVPCAFNPCTVDDFCGTGRTCEIDENCRHNCKCEPGSSHELCLTDEKRIVQTTVAPNKCTFNLCDIPSACDGNRKCTMDRMCRIQCECTDDSTHVSCPSYRELLTKETEIARVTTTQTIQKSTDVCERSCQHGRCVRSSDTFVCKCNQGWGGSQCDQSLNHCSLECGLGFKCTWFADIEQICVTDIDATTSLDGVSPFLSTKTFNVCSEAYGFESKPYMYCDKNLKCQHGLCTIRDDDTHCECDPGAAGPECDIRCCLDCGEHRICTLTEDRIPTCECRQNVTGENCSLSEYKAGPYEPATWYLWVAGVSLCMFAVLLVLLVVLPYCLWRHRVIVVMKIIHYFQGYEDEDDRQWDAFVSYKSSTADEKFVVQTLFPKLERELGFKLHVHFRDFQPGETIANNILRAVLGSRRTILIVSPDYAKAEWTKFEYQVAQQEMLKRKHRIIPILFTDVTEAKTSLDPNLKAILGSVTYLEWPKCGTKKKEEKFWKRLELSLPKKRTSSEPKSDIREDVGYETIRPDSVDIILESKKHDRGIRNGYTSYKPEPEPEPEENYDIINEAEMNKINNSVSGKHETHSTTSDDTKSIDRNDIMKKISEITDINEHEKNDKNLKNDINSDGRKNNETYIGILNGGFHSMEAEV